jgi:hypothetical protein
VAGLRLSPHVVYLFAREDEDTAVLIIIITLHPIHPDVVIRHDGKIQASRNRILGNLGVPLNPNAVGRLHVHVTCKFYKISHEISSHVSTIDVQNAITIPMVLQVKAVAVPHKSYMNPD